MNNKNIRGKNTTTENNLLRNSVRSPHFPTSEARATHAISTLMSIEPETSQIKARRVRLSRFSVRLAHQRRRAHKHTHTHYQMPDARRGQALE